MDNTQETSIELTDLAYLAGLIDGEGCIAIQKSKQNGRPTYAINFKVTNSDPNIVDRVQSIMLGLGVNPYIREKNNQDRPEWKSWFDIYLTKGSNIQTVLRAVLPYLVGKRARAFIMLRYIDKMIDKEVAFQTMKTYNSKGGPSETTREAPAVRDEDIVHAN